jgi:predicted transcriptional regulator
MRLRKYRRKLEITQEELAEKARISRVYLAMLETRRQDPRLSVLVKLARALKVKVGDLVD